MKSLCQVLDYEEESRESWKPAAAIEARKASLKVEKEISLTMKDGKGKNFEKTFSD